MSIMYRVFVILQYAEDQHVFKGTRNQIIFKIKITTLTCYFTNLFMLKLQFAVIIFTKQHYGFHTYSYITL